MSAFASGFAPDAFDTGEGGSWAVAGDLELALPITLSVIPAPIYNAPPASGGIDPNPGAGLTGVKGAVWTPVITVGSKEVTDRCFGEVRVEAREGAARIAEFTLRPQPGEIVSVATWVGQPVTIDVAKVNPDGSRGALRRLFTGVIDTPVPDLARRMIAVSATDDLQGVIDAMSDAEVDALTGGRWSAVIFDEAKSHGHQRASDRLSTRPASLDLSPFRVPRVTLWAGEDTLGFYDDEIEDGSLQVSVAARSQLVNQVDISFDYRYPRLKIEGYSASYRIGGASLGAWEAYIKAGNIILTRQAVESAISSAGATVQGDINWIPLPDTFNGGTFLDPWIWVAPPPEIAEQLCRGFSCLCTFDYAKYNEEAHRITVRNAASIALVGKRTATLQSALEAAYMEPTQYEAHTFLSKGKIDKALQPVDKLTASAAVTRAQNPTLSKETDRDAANAAMETLIDIAKTMIAASHRNGRVDFVAPVHPDLDLDQFAGVFTSALSAIGKVVSLTHSLSTDTGRAVTSVSLAISSLSGVGVDHPETPTTPPKEDAPKDVNLAVHASYRFNSGEGEDHNFTVTFPGVEEAERAKTTKEMRAEYAATVTEDLFMLEFE